MNLIIEKRNLTFINKTKSKKQVTGLTNCLKMICSKVALTRIVVDSMDHVELAIQKYKPKKVIFGHACFYFLEFDAIAKKYPMVEFYILFHSAISFLQGQHVELTTLLNSKNSRIKIICNDDFTYKAFPHSLLANNIYSKEKHYRTAVDNKDILKVICAGSVRDLKNILAQAIGAILYADKYDKKLEFYINASRNEQGDGTIKSLNILFKNNPKHEIKHLVWLEHNDFVKSLDQYDFGLQVSMCETYNIVAADYINAGLPSVFSDQIKFCAKEVIANTQNPFEIMTKMEVASQYVDKNRVFLDEFNGKAVREWEMILGDSLKQN